MKIKNEKSGIIIDGQMDVVLSFRNENTVIYLDGSNWTKGNFLKNFHLLKADEKKEFVFLILDRKYKVNKLQRFLLRIILSTLSVKKTNVVSNLDGINVVEEDNL